MRTHANAIVACDFFMSVTASFRVLYVFVAMEIGSRRILHTNVTAHPTAEWTIQQFREFLAFDHPYRFVIHDRECLDFLIPLNERHLRRTISEFVVHYNRGRPHSALGPGIPEPPQAMAPASVHRTNFPLVTASSQRRFSAGCIMNMAWKRRPHDAGLSFCGAQHNE